MNSLREIARVILCSRRFFLCGHMNPDGDSIGSVLALGLALKTMGKEVVMASPDPVPENLTFLPFVEQVKTDLSGGFDVETMIMLDCSGPDRLGPSIKKIAESAREVIVLDHHPTGDCWAAYYYIDEHAAATGEIVYDLLSILGVVLTPEIAVCLYTALVTDTGSFQYRSTTAETHRRAASLVAKGVDVARINVKLYGEKSQSHIRVLGAAINRLQVKSGGKVAWISITRDMLAELDASTEDCNGLIDYPRMIKGVEVALLFHEIKPELYKISFRSKGRIDVNEVARVFGGGGHVLASGCRLKGSLSEVEKLVLIEVDKAILGMGDQ